MTRLCIGAAALAVICATPALACSDIATSTVKLSGCVDDIWQAGDGGKGPVEYSYQTADQNFVLQIITETAAYNDKDLESGILGNAISAAGKPENVKLIGRRSETVDGKTFNELEYTISDGTFTITYQNLYYSEPGFGTVQILVYSTPDMATQAAFRQGQFAASLKLGS